MKDPSASRVRVFSIRRRSRLTPFAGNNTFAGKQCPLCKHEPFFSNASKAVRGTARSYLKSLANADASKPIETTPAATNGEPKDIPPSQIRDSAAIEADNTKDGSNGDILVKTEPTKEQDDQADQVVQSIEVRLPIYCNSASTG